MTSDDLRARIEATGLSKRQIARITGLNDRTVREYLEGRIQIPEWLNCAMKSIELEHGLRDLLAGTKTGREISYRKVRELYERFAPPQAKAPRLARVKAAPKPAPAPKKPPRHRFRRKTYDSPWLPWPEPEHPTTAGFRTSFGSVKTG